MCGYTKFGKRKKQKKNNGGLSPKKIKKNINERKKVYNPIKGDDTPKGMPRPKGKAHSLPLL